MIAALHPCSFVDYPGRLAAVVFTQGCNLRCRYCHNPELLPRSGGRGLAIPELLRFLDTRRGRLSAVVVTGGEPTLHDDMPDLLGAIRARGFAVKLDTNGTRPGVVRRLIAAGLVDYLAVDVKTAPGTAARRLCGDERQPVSALDALAAAVAPGVRCEARTTVVDGHHSVEGLNTIARALAARGVPVWRLQSARRPRTNGPYQRGTPKSLDVAGPAIALARSLGIDAAERCSSSGRPGARRTGPGRWACPG